MLRIFERIDTVITRLLVLMACGLVIFTAFALARALMGGLLYVMAG